MTASRAGIVGRHGLDRGTELDQEPNAGGANLRYTVHLLRRALAPAGEAIQSGGGRLVLNPACHWEIDLERFEELERVAHVPTNAPGLTEELLREAAGVYGGPPLPHDVYEDWAIPVRDRVVRVARSVHLELGRLAENRGTHAEASACYERVLADDPLDEEAPPRSPCSLNCPPLPEQPKQRASVGFRRRSVSVSRDRGHDWDDDRAVQILRTCRRALSDRDKLLVVKRRVDRDCRQALAALHIDLARETML